MGMWRVVLVILGLWTWPALAQPADCEAVPNGPPLPMQVWPNLQGRPGVPKSMRGQVGIDLGNVPTNGTTCDADAELPDDVLHGAPAPHGLLQGDGPKDVLHNRPTGHVVVRPMPPSPPP